MTTETDRIHRLFIRRRLRDAYRDLASTTSDPSEATARADEQDAMIQEILSTLPAKWRLPTDGEPAARPKTNQIADTYTEADDQYHEHPGPFRVRCPQCHHQSISVVNPVVCPDCRNPAILVEEDVIARALQAGEIHITSNYRKTAIELSKRAQKGEP